MSVWIFRVIADPGHPWEIILSIIEKAEYTSLFISMVKLQAK